MNIQEIFNDNLSRLLLGFRPSKIAVAVSGGADSMMACYMAKDFCSNNGIELHALVVDHMLREGSSIEAQYVSDFLKDLDVNVVVLKWHGGKPSSNIQAIARNERYKIMSSYCKLNGIDHLITGHHADDQAETVFMRIMRGSGVDGISGIKQISKISDINILRPMLSIDKEDIISAIEELEWTYVDDPSNKNEKFSRVRVRNFLSEPEWRFMKSKLVLLSKNASRSRDYLEQQTSLFLRDFCFICPAGTFSINLNAFLSSHEEIALRSLCRVLMYVGGSDVPTRLAQLERVYNDLLLNRWKDRTLFGCLIRVRRGNLIVIREWDDIPPLTKLMANYEVLWDGRFVIKSNVGGFIKRLSVSDIKLCLDEYASASHVSYDVLKTLPFVFNDEGFVIAAPLLYKSINHDVLIALKDSAIINYR